MMSQFLVTPTFGWLLLMTAAAIGGHFTVLRFLGVLAIVISAAMVASVALFSLDTIQIRQGADQGGKFVTAVSATFASIKIALASVVVFLVGLGGLKSGRGSSERRRGGLVVGAS